MNLRRLLIFRQWRTAPYYQKYLVLRLQWPHIRCPRVRFMSAEYNNNNSLMLHSLRDRSINAFPDQGQEDPWKTLVGAFTFFLIRETRSVRMNRCVSVPTLQAAHIFCGSAAPYQRRKQLKGWKWNFLRNLGAVRDKDPQMAEVDEARSLQCGCGCGGHCQSAAVVPLRFFSR
ncbi:uncharacterized protein BDV14DRAFT_72182 [Aspergillus stella-maris]|uniref:uncharacterized protein n=1 Tax=Aspergillus stella-maris TaxID=1810926 RepID=UPI003CCD751E